MKPLFYLYRKHINCLLKDNCLTKINLHLTQSRVQRKYKLHWVAYYPGFDTHDRQGL